MNKELTPLEAFNKIAKFTIETGHDDDHFHEVELQHHKSLWRSFRKVETALNDNQFYKHIINKICKYLGLDMTSHRDLVETENEILNTLIEHEKKLIALEIIKERQVNVYYLLEADSVETYNKIIDIKYANYENFYLTQEQFDLLKEVLK